MSDQIIMRLRALGQGELQAVVREIVAQDVKSVGELTITKIGRSAGHATAGVFHVRGHALAQEKEIEWSAVVKALGTPENRSTTGNPGYDPYLEVEVYRSHVFDKVCGGVRGPRCYAIQQYPDLLLLWLEDLSHAPQPPWDAHHFVATARHLGQFNAYWPEDALPQWPWLSRSSFRSDFTGSEKLQAHVKNLSTKLDHPLVQTFVPGAEIETLLDLWDTWRRPLHWVSVTWIATPKIFSLSSMTSERLIQWRLIG
jgi:hypothetical protein